jgi:S-formylglutathione hydrolase FrmB
MKAAIITKYEDVLRYDSFDELLNHNKFIGFETEFCNGFRRFLIINGGTQTGLAASPYSNWAEKEEQKEYTAHYYVFDSAKELYQWLAEGENS